MQEATALLPPRHAASLRADVWQVLRFRSSITHRSRLQRASYALELGILLLILLNVIVAVYESSIIADQPSSQMRSYDVFLYVSTIIFSFEYVLRLWSCVEDDRFAHPLSGRIRWMLRPLSVIDFVALVPFYMEICFQYAYELAIDCLIRRLTDCGRIIPSFRGALTLRGLRLLRVITFLRLERSYSAMKNLRLIFRRKSNELWIVSYLTAVIVLTSSTTIFFLEHEAQPHVFSSVGVGAWWSIETITSLGYGDIVPITSAGRFFSSVLALWGILLFTIPGALVSSGFIEVMLDQQHHALEESLRLSVSREMWSTRSSFDEANGDEEQKLKALEHKMHLLVQSQKQLEARFRAQERQLEAIRQLLARSVN